MMDYEVVEEIIYGLNLGLCLDRLQVLSAELQYQRWDIVCRMASVISKMGFVFLEQGFSRMLVPICISISICCSASGFYYQSQGLKHGRALVVSVCAAMASIVTGVLSGMQGEQFPLFIVAGVILLVSSTWLLRHLPLRHFI